MANRTSSLFLALSFLLLTSATSLNHREGKFLMDLFNVVRLNPASRAIIGILLTLPMSVFAPDISFFHKDERALGGQRFWPFKPSRLTFPTCPARVRNASMSEDVDVNTCKAQHSCAGASVEDYLSMLRIQDGACQELFICEISKNPRKFLPLSKLLLKNLAANDISDVFNSTDYSLLEAAQVGTDNLQDCQKRYWECPVSATSMINMKLLRRWQYVSRFINLKFVAATEANLRNY